MLSMRELHWHITVLALAPFRSTIDFDCHRTPFQTPEENSLLSQRVHSRGRHRDQNES
jgi:hypothetical protein